MVVDLIQLLKKIFELKGVEVLDREPEDLIWLKYDEGMELIYIEDRDRVTGDAVLEFSRATEQVHANKVIICLKDCTYDAKTMAEKLGIELLTKAEFSHILGELILEIHEMGKMDELHILEEGDVEVEGMDYGEEQVEEELDYAEEDTIPIFLEEVGSEGEEKIIKPTISADEASALARNYLHGQNQEMILLPHYVFEFSLEVIVEGSMDIRPVTGAIAIDALSKKHYLWKRGYETTTRLDVDFRKMEPKIGLEEAREMAESAVNTEFSREEEVKIEGDNVTIIEKRRTRPKKGSLRVDFLGLYYLPVWVIEGRKGRVMVNAVSGEIMKKEIY